MGIGISSDCFNCTFMELKFANDRGGLVLVPRFNCTFMELKSKHLSHILKINSVLIVPLWN